MEPFTRSLSQETKQIKCFPYCTLLWYPWALQKLILSGAIKIRGLLLAQAGLWPRLKNADVALVPHSPNHVSPSIPSILGTALACLAFDRDILPRCLTQTGKQSTVSAELVSGLHYALSTRSTFRRNNTSKEDLWRLQHFFRLAVEKSTTLWRLLGGLDHITSNKISAGIHFTEVVVATWLSFLNVLAVVGGFSVDKIGFPVLFFIVSFICVDSIDSINAKRVLFHHSIFGFQIYVIGVF
jgi:hypothetical protein